MNICKETNETPNPKIIPGHIYYCKGISISFGKLAIMTKRYDYVSGKDIFTLHSLTTGDHWTSEKDPYGTGYHWTDVTDQYCLQKVK